MENFVIRDGILEKYTGSGGHVVIPEGVEEIGEEAFEGCHDLTIYAPADSYAAQYAEDNWITWKP